MAKTATVTLVGPIQVHPTLSLQTFYRHTVMEEKRLALDMARSKAEVDEIIQREVQRLCAERDGYVVKTTKNTLEVTPGSTLGTKKVRALIDGPIEVTVEAPRKVEDAVAYIEDREQFEALT